MKVIYYRVKLVNNEWTLTHIARCQAGKGVTYMVNQRSKMGCFLSAIDTEDGDTWARLGLAFSEYEGSRGITWEPITESNFDPSLKDGPSKEDFDLYMKEYMENLNRIYRKEQVLKKNTFMTHGHRKISEGAICDKLISLANLQTRLDKSSNDGSSARVFNNVEQLKLFLLEKSPTEFMHNRIRVSGMVINLNELPNANIVGMLHPGLGKIYFTFDHFALNDTGAKWDMTTNHYPDREVTYLGNLLTSHSLTPSGITPHDVPEIWSHVEKRLIGYRQFQQFLLAGATSMGSVEAKYQDGAVPHTVGGASLSEATQEKDIYYQIADTRREIDKKKRELTKLSAQLNELEVKLSQSNQMGSSSMMYNQPFTYGPRARI